MDALTQVRGYHFLLGILLNQESDPFCRNCNAFKNTLTGIREGLATFTTHHAEAMRQVPPEFDRLFVETARGIAGIDMPTQTTSQKKAGNCRLPEGHCFLKSPFAFCQRI